MIRLGVLALALLVVPAAAQQQPSPMEQGIKSQLGDLLFSNIALLARVTALTEENAKLKAQIEAMKKAAEKP